MSEMFRFLKSRTTPPGHAWATLLSAESIKEQEIRVEAELLAKKRREQLANSIKKEARTSATDVKVIGTSTSIEVLHRPGKAAYALLTFGPRGDLADGKHFIAQRVAETSHVEVIGLMDRNKGWYPKSEIAQLAPTITELTHRYERIVAFGTGMGGYAALRYGALLGATHVLAFAPVYSISSADGAAADARWVQDFRADLHSPCAIQSQEPARRSLVVYDSASPYEAASAAAIARVCPAIILINSPYTGDVSGIFPSAKAFADLFGNWVHNRVPAVRWSILTNRRHARSRAVNMAMQVSWTKPVLAMKILEKHHDKFQSEQIGELYTRILDVSVTKGLHEFLEKIITEIPEAIADDPKVQTSVASAFIRLGYVQRGIDILKKCVAVDPGNPWQHFALATGLSEAMQVELAARSIERAIELAPLEPAFLWRMSDIQVKLGAVEVARYWADRAVSVAPLSPKSYYYMAGLLMYHCNDLKRAIECASKACTLEPSSKEYAARYAELNKRLQ